MADARSVHRCVPVAAPARRGVKLRQLEPSVAIRSLQHRDLRADALETHHAVHPTALERSLGLQLESELDEERRRGGEVVDHDAHVVHALDRQELNGKEPRIESREAARQLQAYAISTPPSGRAWTDSNVKSASALTG